MQFFILIAAVVAIAKASTTKDCSIVDVHGVSHEKIVLKTGITSPYQLAIDHNTSHLFFSYSTRGPDNFKSAFINLKSNEFHTISNIAGGFANAVDGKNHIVYLGGNDGIYKFDYNTNSAKFLGAKDKSIWQLYYKDRLYFTDFPSETAYIFEDESFAVRSISVPLGVVKKVPELKGTNAMLLAFDGNDNLFYSNSEGLFCYKKGESKAVLLGDYNVNGFTNDINNHVYFSNPNGIYAIDTNGMEVLKIVNIDGLFGVAIDADNSIIYADDESIVKLKPTAKKCD